MKASPGPALQWHAVRIHAAESPAATLVLGHGAGAGQDHPWIARVADRLAGRGITVVTFDFPYVAQGRKMPDRGPVLEDAFQSTWAAVAARMAGPLFAGGKSMGGRIATQVAARSALDPAPAGLVCFGYPLHPPGKPADRRDRHLPLVKAPLLLLSGTRDPFGSPDELRDLVRTLPNASLALFEGGNHSIEGRKRTGDAEDVLERAIHTAADWMRQVASRGSPSGGLDPANEPRRS
jgi:predicted alpha/beta-hydrolase family hydrolase